MHSNLETLNCKLCNFSETCGDAQYFAHLKIHIHNNETELSVFCADNGRICLFFFLSFFCTGLLHFSVGCAVWGNCPLMRWSCKCCTFFSPNQHTLIVHYKLKHCVLFPVSMQTVCSFRTESSLKKRLTRDHSQGRSKQVTARLNCELCNFSETCSDTQYFAHLNIHIHSKETVKCPFKDCSFQSSVYSTFRAHKSKKHHLCTVDNFRENLYQTFIQGTSKVQTLRHIQTI